MNSYKVISSKEGKTALRIDQIDAEDKKQALSKLEKIYSEKRVIKKIEEV